MFTRNFFFRRSVSLIQLRELKIGIPVSLAEVNS